MEGIRNRNRNKDPREVDGMSWGEYELVLDVHSFRRRMYGGPATCRCCRDIKRLQPGRRTPAPLLPQAARLDPRAKLFAKYIIIF